VIFVPVDPELFPACRQETAVPASKSAIGNKAIDSRNWISSRIAEGSIRRLSILQAKVLGNNGISGLAINIQVLIPLIGIEIRDGVSVKSIHNGPVC
jgi:hypothetical protein